MSAYSLIIPATSPVITYHGNWLARSLEDTQDVAPQSVNGDNPPLILTFNFTGTGLEFYGHFSPSKSFPECGFHTKIDGNNVTTEVSLSNSPQEADMFFSVGDLHNKLHEVAFVIDTGFCSGSFIRQLRLWLEEGQIGTVPTQVMIGHNDHNVSFIGKWDSDTANKLSYTDQANASVEVSFFGNAISIYGPIGTSFGLYIVVLDGELQPERWNATSTIEASNELLFYAHNLTSGSHLITLINPKVDDRPPLMGFYQAVVTTYDTPDNTHTSISSSATSFSTISTNSYVPESTSALHKLKTGTVAGGIIGGLVALGLVVLLTLILARRIFRRRYGPPRFSIIDGDSEGFVAPPTSAIFQQEMEEVDVPPPYRGVFPSQAGSNTDNNDNLRTRDEVDTPARPSTSNDQLGAGNSDQRTQVFLRKRDQIERRRGGVDATSAVVPPGPRKGRLQRG